MTFERTRKIWLVVEKYELILAREFNAETTSTHDHDSQQRQKQMADLVEGNWLL